jgi:hypothetical protein
MQPLDGPASAADTGQHVARFENPLEQPLVAMPTVGVGIASLS